MALNATTLRDAILADLDTAGLYPTPAAKSESKDILLIIVSNIVDHIVAEAEVSGQALTGGIVDSAGHALVDDAVVEGTIS